MKRAIKITLVLLLIASTALAAGASLSLKSSQKLDKQFEAFRAYLDKLPASDRAAWLKELSIFSSENQEMAAFPGTDSAQPQQESAGMVWIPKSGKKYHSAASCSNMKGPRQVTRADAIRQGFEPCKRCKPQ